MNLGNSLSAIATVFYGEGTLYPSIREADDLTCITIRGGQVLLLPPLPR